MCALHFSSPPKDCVYRVFEPVLHINKEKHYFQFDFMQFFIYDAFKRAISSMICQPSQTMIYLHAIENDVKFYIVVYESLMRYKENENK